MINFFRWLRLIFAASKVVLASIVRLPFGACGSYLRRAGGRFGELTLKSVKADFTVDGLERLDPNKQYIFAGNHQSYADIFLVFAALNRKGIRILYMAKAYLYKIPLFGTSLKHMGTIKIEKDDNLKAMKTMTDAIRRLEDGNSLAIFPEGSRSIDGELTPFKRGAFMLAEKSGLPIVPFALSGTFEIMSRGNMAINPGKTCHISFMPVIEPGEMSSKKLKAHVEKLIAGKYDEIRTIRPKKQKAQAVLAFGGNIGDTQAIINSAIDVLQKEGAISEVKTSYFYKTRSLLKDNQADYINAVCVCNTQLTALDLLSALKETEHRFGRAPSEIKWQSRELDIDILDYDGFIMETEALSIPHPEMYKRSFVLYPMRDIAPDYINPVTGKTLNEMIEALEDDLSIERV